MYNCFFDDTNYMASVRVASAFKDDSHGYFIEVKVRKIDVPEFLKLGIIPEYSSDGYFFIQVRLTNKTFIQVNGTKIWNLSEPRLAKLPVNQMHINELILKRYSIKNKRRIGQCYATRFIFRIDL